jgi:hypothetical protein
MKTSRKLVRSLIRIRKAPRSTPQSAPAPQLENMIRIVDELRVMFTARAMAQREVA